VATEVTDADGSPASLAVEPIAGPLDATVRPPGSKSLTNRALVCAALARGTTVLDGVLVADDTEAMMDCLRDLGVPLALDRATRSVTVDGTAGEPPTTAAVLDARLSGTTSRFVAPVAALVRGHVLIDGGEPLRRRPMGDLLDALESLGAEVEPLGEPGHLPVRIATRRGLDGGRVRVTGDVSSQFLSALLLSAPCFRDGLEVEVTTPLVSRPYVEMTTAVMAAFGAPVEVDDDLTHLRVPPVGYRAVDRYSVEPDASAASYFAAAAAVVGGTVRIEGLGRRSLQGDVAFIDVLASMGVEVAWHDDAVEVTGGGPLRGVEVDFSDISDTAQTLAVVAPFAEGPTTVTGIGFIRGKETDRLAAVVTELQRLGIDAREDPDGFTIRPGTPSPGSVRTYDDHRMAMSFALLGLRVPGITIEDPGCVAKTYPGFWDDLGTLRHAPEPGTAPATP
jgi:3-phosphoshikimate 1-carboxyvinyltransferase